MVERQDDPDLPRPKVRLIGRDGNAYAILGEVMRAARAAGWSEGEIASFYAEATSRDYNHLLATVIRRFDIE